MFKNLAAAIFLTERDAEGEDNAPKVKGRIVTTLQNAKEIRPIVEKAITLARKTLDQAEKASEFGTQAERQTAEWRAWRKGPQWQKWAAAMAPIVAARRKAVQILGDKQAVKILFSEIAPRFKDRPGGYTRILRLARPRVGDAGTRAILEFVGVRDRVAATSEKPSFGDDE